MDKHMTMLGFLVILLTQIAVLFHLSRPVPEPDPTPIVTVTVENMEAIMDRVLERYRGEVIHINSEMDIARGLNNIMDTRIAQQRWWRSVIEYLDARAQVEASR